MARIFWPNERRSPVTAGAMRSGEGLSRDPETLRCVPPRRSGQAGGDPGERLDDPGWGAVLLVAAAGDGDGIAVGSGQLGGERGAVVADDGQPRAVRGTVCGEGGQDDRAAAGQRGTERPEVGGAVGWAGEEGVDGPVVPDLGGARWP